MNGGSLRPLGIGESLDAGIKIYLGRWKPLVAVVFVVTAPVLFLQALIQVSAGSTDALFETDPRTNLPELDAQGFGIFIAATLLAFVLSVVASAIATAGAFRIVSGAYLGDEPDWRESLRFGVRRLGSVLWVTLLTGLASLLGLAACLVGYFWVSTVFAVAVPVLLLEGVRGKSAMGRSYRLVEGRFWPVLAVIFLATLLGFIVQGFLSTPVFVATLVAGNELVTAVASFVGNLVGTTLVTPFLAAVTMVVYFDLRVRKEGFDLAVLAGRVGVDPPDQYPMQPGVRTMAPAWARPGAAPPPSGWPPPPPSGASPPPPSPPPEQPPWERPDGDGPRPAR